MNLSVGVSVTDRARSIAFICGLSNMIVYGLIPVASKQLMYGCNPLLFSGLATFISSLPLLAIVARSGHLKETFSGAYLPALLRIASLTAIATGLFFVGTSLTSAMNTGLLEQIEPVYSIILAAFVLGEAITRRQLFATLLMVAGAVVVAYRGFDALNSGDMMILAAPLFFQCAHLQAKQILPRVGNVLVVPAARLFYSGAIVSIVAIWLKPSDIGPALSSATFGRIVIFGLIFRTLDMVLWYRALRDLPLAVLSALLPIGAGVSFLAAMIFLNEQASFGHYIGLTFILTGLIILSREK